MEFNLRALNDTDMIQKRLAQMPQDTSIHHADEELEEHCH